MAAALAVEQALRQAPLDPIIRVTVRVPPADARRYFGGSTFKT